VQEDILNEIGNVNALKSDASSPVVQHRRVEMNELLPGFGVPRFTSDSSDSIVCAE